MWLMWIGALILALLVVLIYTKGYDAHKPGLGQGVQDGPIIGLLLSAPQSLLSDPVLPTPGVLACWWYAAGMVENVATSVATGLIGRPA